MMDDAAPVVVLPFAPWWLPTEGKIKAAEEAAAERARLAVEEAAKAESPLAARDRIDAKLKEVKAALAASMRARNFMQCVDLQAMVDLLKKDRAAIPGLSEEMEAAVVLQSLARMILARPKVRERRFQRLLPPDPWQTHIDPNSGLTYWWDWKILLPLLRCCRL